MKPKGKNITNKAIVKSKYKKAWSWKCGNEIWIMDGELPKGCKYFPLTFSSPAGQLIAKGKNVKQAWLNSSNTIKK